MTASMQIAHTCEGLGAIGSVRARTRGLVTLGTLPIWMGSAAAASMLGPMAANPPQKIAAGTEELAPSAETVAQRAKASAQPSLRPTRPVDVTQSVSSDRATRAKQKNLHKSLRFVQIFCILGDSIWTEK